MTCKVGRLPEDEPQTFDDRLNNIRDPSVERSFSF